jgi:hypothetical protein
MLGAQDGSGPPVEVYIHAVRLSKVTSTSLVGSISSRAQNELIPGPKGGCVTSRRLVPSNSKKWSSML